MVSQTRSAGQALIETTLAITLITLIVGLTMALVFHYKKQFKHDYLAAPDNTSVTETLTHAFETTAAGKHSHAKILYEKTRERVLYLKSQGWRETKLAPEKSVHILQKGQRLEMLLGLDEGRQSVPFRGIEFSSAKGEVNSNED